MTRHDNDIQNTFWFDHSARSATAERPFFNEYRQLDLRLQEPHMCCGQSFLSEWKTAREVRKYWLSMSNPIFGFIEGMPASMVSAIAPPNRWKSHISVLMNTAAILIWRTPDATFLLAPGSYCV